MIGIGTRINQILAKKNISRNDLANRLKISYKQLHKIIQNQGVTTLENIKDISDFLDVPSDFLFADMDKDFIIFAIDDYIGKIDKHKASEILNNITNILVQNDEEK